MNFLNKNYSVFSLIFTELRVNLEIFERSAKPNLCHKNVTDHFSNKKKTAFLPNVLHHLFEQNNHINYGLF